MITRVVFASFLAVVAVVIVKSLPDLVRYLKIREM
jgi:hypothetical protein